MKNTALVAYLDELLNIEAYRDYAPNGLQVEGKIDVKTVICGVTASQALIDIAIAEQADALLVHHGYFWKGEDQAITGIKYQRLKKLLQNQLNLLAYHLPLDGHDTLGNNAQLGQLLKIADASAIAPFDLLWTGRLPSVSADDFAQTITQRLGREPLLIHGGAHPIEKIAWCSGGAQGYITQAVAHGADAFISGEVSEKTYHEAKEYGIHYFAAGHHATERGGIQALAAHLNKETDLRCTFVDCPNPV